jgi:hemerythrin superfamily protein
MKTQKVASKKATTKSTEDALMLLKRDHKKVRDLFEEFESARNADKKSQLAAQICEELTLHATCEEEILYPAAQEALKDPQLVFEAELEHSTARDLIAQIESQSPQKESLYS